MLNEIFDSNNYGKMQVIEYVNSLKVKVRFLDTGYETYSRSERIRNGGVADKIARKENADKWKFKIHKSKGFGDFIIEEYDPKFIKHKIRFLDTGGYSYANTGDINRGGVADPFAVTVAGVGIVGLGYPGAVGSKHMPEYRLWHHMLNRCYNEKELKKHPTYVKCSVDPRWHYYQQFVKDIKNLLNYEHWIKNPNDWQLDKDIKIRGNIQYSPEACIFVAKSDNSKDASFRRCGNEKELQALRDRILNNNTLEKFFL